MGILQIQLQAGRNYIQLHQSIARTPVRIQSYAAHFNVEDHGFYLARVRFPPSILGTMNARNNLYDNTEIILPLDHREAFFDAYTQWELGLLNFQSSFEVDVDFAQGIQMVPVQNTGLSGAVSQNPVTGVWTPAGATGNNQFTTETGFGHSTALSNVPVASALVTLIDATPEFVSVGLSADRIMLANVYGAAGATTNQQDYTWRGAIAPYNTTTGQLQGFIPFCYSLILTLEYDGTSTEARIQNLY